MRCRTRWSLRSPTCRRSTGRVVVCPDVSGSMPSPVTGHRRGSTTARAVHRCCGFGGGVRAAEESSATVLPFEQAVVPVDLNSRDSVMTNAGKLASIGGGGTNCSAPVQTAEYA